MKSSPVLINVKLETWPGLIPKYTKVVGGFSGSPMQHSKYFETYWVAWGASVSLLATDASTPATVTEQRHGGGVEHLTNWHQNEDLNKI